MKQTVGQYVKQQRKEYHLTQEELSLKAGVGLRFVREQSNGDLHSPNYYNIAN